MYTTHQQSNGLRTAIIVSLLIHLMLATATTVHIYFNRDRTPNHQDFAAPELRAGQSDYGATVVFADLPEQQETEKEPYPFEVPNGASLTQQDEITEHTTQQSQPTPDVTVQTYQQPELTTSQHARTIQKVAQEEQQKPHSQKRYGLPPRSTFARGQRDRSPVSLTLAALAKGFLEHAKQQGADSVNAAGNRKPNFGDIQYISYLQKLSRSVQSSIRRNNRIFNLPYSVQNITTVQFAINRAGNIVDLNLKNPTGVHDLDSFFTSCVTDAAPFPPLPDHFQQDVFIRGITFYINMPAGVHRHPRWIAQ